MNEIVVYHWWSSKNDPPVWANHRAPIILSIATLRAVNPTVPIMVLDVSSTNETWGDYPKKLNFLVVPTIAHLYSASVKIRGWKHLSRIFDVNKVNKSSYEKNLIYCDSDVFWIKDPLPLACNSEKFCFDGWNTGFYYYKRNFHFDFMSIFDAYTHTAIYSKELRGHFRQYVGYEDWYEVWDEMILTYMKNKHPELFNIIPRYEHVCMRDLLNVDPEKIKMLHCNGMMVENKATEYKGLKNHSRGLVCLIFEEFFAQIRKVLSEKDIKEIFSDAERQYYMPKQISLREKANDLELIKDETGHYHVDKWLTQS